MTSVRTFLLGASLAAMAAGGSVIYAQETVESGSADVVVPMEKQVELSPAEMEKKATEVSSTIALARKRVDELRVEAKKSKDVIKLNCINDKLVQINELVRIADVARLEFDAAIAVGDDAERHHRFAVITISGEKVVGLRNEAEACVGEEIDYLGPLDLGVDGPDVPDDPTLDVPLGDDDIEPPGYASPFY